MKLIRISTPLRGVTPLKPLHGYIAILSIFFILSLSGCQYNDKIVTMTGLCTRVGSLPFTELIVKPKIGPPVTLSFKRHPELKQVIERHYLNQDIQVTGHIQKLKLSTADKKQSFVQYVMILEKVSGKKTPLTP